MATVRYTLDTLPEAAADEIEQLKSVRDEDLDYSDIPPLSDDFWERAESRLYLSDSKKP